MNAKSDSQKDAKVSKESDASKKHELTEEELKKIAGGKKLTLDEVQSPSVVIGPDIPHK